MIHYAIITLLLILWGGSIYLLLRPKGLVDSLIENRDRRIVVLEAQVADMTGRIGVVASEVAENASYAQHNIAQVKNRLTSLETKAGKANAQSDKEALRQEFFNVLQQQQHQLNTGG